MSARDIDELMDIWATSVAKDEDEAASSFSSHEHMYATIDKIKHGGLQYRMSAILALIPQADNYRIIRCGVMILMWLLQICWTTLTSMEYLW
jgi:hypothetical protein